jgi:hypothetical protein
MKTKEALRDIIDTLGRDVIAEKQKLNAVIADLIFDDKQMKFLLELSIKAEIPIKISSFLDGQYIEDYYADKLIYSVNEKDFNLKLNALKTQFKNDFSLEISAVNSVFDCWVYALEPEPVISYDQRLMGFYEYQNWLGNIISDNLYQEANTFSQGLAVVGAFPEVTDEEIEFWGGINLSEVKYGFINREGKEVIPLIYDEAKSFEGGLARVSIDYKRGFIDRNGDWVKDEK